MNNNYIWKIQQYLDVEIIYWNSVAGRRELYLSKQKFNREQSVLYFPFVYKNKQIILNIV